MLNKILKNDYSLNIINKLYVVITGLISSIFLTRYLGLIDRGNFSYIIQIVTIATIIVNLGIPQSYTYYFRKNEGKIYKDFLNIFSLQFIFLLVIYIFSVIILKLDAIYLYVLLMLPFSSFSQQMESAMAVENIRLKIKIHILNSTFKVIAYGFMFIFFERHLFIPLLITILIYTFTILTYIYYGNVRPKPLTVNKTELLSIINYSWIPMFTQLLVSLNYSIDIIFLRHIGTAVELGLYSTAVAIINYFWLVPDAFKEVLISRVARRSSIDAILLSVKLSIFLIFILIFGFAIFGRFAINLLYGSEFVNSYYPILILSFGAISMVFYKIIGIVVLAEGKRWFYFISLFASVLISAILNAITIPIYGMYGAAVSSVISYTICGGSFLIYYSKYKNIKIRDILLFSIQDFNNFKKILKNEK